MKRHYILLLLFLFFICGIFMVYAQKNVGDSSKDVNYCIQCHLTLNGKPRSVVLEWENSIHEKKNLECD